MPIFEWSWVLVGTLVLLVPTTIRRVYHMGPIGALTPRWCPRQHTHEWTPWVYVWDEVTSTRTTVQERSCKTCGFNEKHDEQKCPPHNWERWERTTINYIDTTTGKKTYSIDGLIRKCQDCGEEQTKDKENNK